MQVKIEPTTLNYFLVSTCIISFFWLIYEPGFSPLITLLSGIAGILTSSRYNDVSKKGENKNFYRKNMLKMVRNLWIKGILENSLKGTILIDLNLEERKEAVEYPLNKVLQIPTQPNHLLQTGTKMLEVFDDMGHTLLILGEPGSGKTTMLLELARDLIARSEKDINEPIPVIFNLSTWIDSKKSINEWLMDQLNNIYKIPSKIALQWIENDELLILLDGLDEIPSAHQNECIKKVNEFRREHFMPLVVCSRASDYESLDVKLELQCAILLLPLTPQQVNDYLNAMGSKADTLRWLIQNNPIHDELSRTPLMLNIMTIVYQDKFIEESKKFDTIEAQRENLFDLYVDYMFKRRGSSLLYSRNKTKHWLSWLAKKMHNNNQSIFIIEEMQPEWLESRIQQWIVTKGIMMLVILFGWLLFGIVLKLIYELVAYTFNAQLVSNLLFLSSPNQTGLIYGLIFGLMIGFITYSEKILLNNKLSKSAKNVLFFGCYYGIIFGIAGLLVFALLGLLVSILALEGEKLLLNAFAGGFSGMLICGLIGGLIFGLGFGRGFASLQHLALRLLLWRDDLAPFNYDKFLNFAVERILMRKGAGGYVFIHRTLMEYFAMLKI